jgi:hypothetical protein
MSHYTIERGIPTPAPRPFKNPMKYPLREMLPGDSFMVPAQNRDTRHRLINRLNTSIYGFVKRAQPDWVFTLRSLYEEGRFTGVRVWRVK